jgi:hypothetical protein
MYLSGLSRREVLPAMTKQRTAPGAVAAGTDLSTTATAQHDGQVSRSVILQSALRIVNRDGVDGSLDVVRGGAKRPYRYTSGEWTDVEGDQKTWKKDRFWG